MEDDFELETPLPEVKDEGEIKLLRNIRIHSLNKRSAESPLRKSKDRKEEGVESGKQRFPSSFKRAGQQPRPVLNSLKFLRTEIGFKKISVSSKNTINY